MILVQHHIKYKEIHGIDEVITITESEHRKIHLRLRKEGKCNISVDKLHKISMQARNRTIKNFDFTLTYGKNTLLHEIIMHNNISGKLSFASCFQGTNGYKLPSITLK